MKKLVMMVCFALMMVNLSCKSGESVSTDENSIREPINLVINKSVSQLIFNEVISNRWNGVIVFVGNNGNGKLYFPESFVNKSSAYNLYLNEVQAPEGYFKVHVKVERKVVVPERMTVGKDEEEVERQEPFYLVMDVPENERDENREGEYSQIDLEIPGIEEYLELQDNPFKACDNWINPPPINSNQDLHFSTNVLYYEDSYIACLIGVYENGIDFIVSNYSINDEPKEFFRMSRNSIFYPGEDENFEGEMYVMKDHLGFFNVDRGTRELLISLFTYLPASMGNVLNCREDWFDRNMFDYDKRVRSYKRVLYELFLQLSLSVDSHVLQDIRVENLSQNLDDLEEINSLQQEIHEHFDYVDGFSNAAEAINHFNHDGYLENLFVGSKLTGRMANLSERYSSLMRGLSVVVNIDATVNAYGITASIIASLSMEMILYRMDIFEEYFMGNVDDPALQEAFDNVKEHIIKMDSAEEREKQTEALKIVFESEQLDARTWETFLQTAGLVATPIIKALTKAGTVSSFLFSQAIESVVVLYQVSSENCEEYKKEITDITMLSTLFNSYTDIEEIDTYSCEESSLDQMTQKIMIYHMVWLVYYTSLKDYERFFPELREESGSLWDLFGFGKIIVKWISNNLIFDTYSGRQPEIEDFDTYAARTAFVFHKLRVYTDKIQDLHYYACVLEINRNNSCGNGLCEYVIGEGCSSCPIDCACRLYDENKSCVSNTCVVQCGDNKCHSIEQNSESCCSDCGCALGYSCEGRSCKIATCGDSRHVCDRNGYYVQENCLNCPEDCGCGGDTYCSARRTCEPIPITCPNGSCENGEDCWNCSSDCGCEPNELCFMYSDNEGGPQCCFPHVYSRCQDENTIVWYNSCDKPDRPVDCIENHQCKMNGNSAECVKQCEPDSYSHCQNGNTIVRYDSCDNFEIVPCGENQVCEIDENGMAKCKDGPICENFCQSVSFCEDNNIHCLNNCQQDIVQEYCGDKSCVEETRECCYLDVKQVCSGGIRYWQDSCGHHIYYGIENCHERGDNWRCRTDRDDENMTKCCQGDDHQECDHNRVYGVDSCGNRSREEDCDYTDTVCHEESGVAWCGEEEEHCGNGTCEPSLGEDCDFCVQDCGCDFDYEFCNSQGECEEQTEQCSYNHDEGELKACSTNDYPSCGEVISSSSGSIRGRMIPVGDEDYFILEQSDMNFPVYLNLDFQDIGQETLFDRMQVCVHWRNMSYSGEQIFNCREGTWCSRDDFSYGDGWTDYGCCMLIFRDEWDFLRIQIGEQNDTSARGQFLVAVGQIGSNLYCGGRYQFDYSIDENNCIDCF